MNFRIDHSIIEKFPDVTIGLIVARGLDNTKESNGVIQKLRAQETRIRASFKSELLSNEPYINVWRKVYSSFGAKPKKYKSSVESLYSMVLKGSEVRSINAIVDIYNFVSLKYMLPVGGEDMLKLNGDVRLTLAGPSETPLLLLGDKELRQPKEGEVIYKDDTSAICRRWNWREADRTKLTRDTTDCIFVIERLLPITNENLQEAISELSQLITEYCGGKTDSHLLDKNHEEVSIN